MLEKQINISRREFLRAGGAAAVAAAATSCARVGVGRRPNVMPASDLAEMIHISAGPAIVGTSPEEAAKLAHEAGIHASWFGNETPRREVQVAAFYIDKYPVTRGQYKKFCDATGKRAPDGALEDPTDEDLHPIVNVSWNDANAYAEWAGKRLATEAEWEKAARGSDGRMWPWGDKFNPRALNWNSKEARDKRKIGTRPVNSHPRGVSPHGVWDMCGNAAEWGGEFRGGEPRLIKSGGWLMSQPYNLRPACNWISQWRHNANPFVGFRCVKEG